jgi:hypothetical protein
MIVTAEMAEFHPHALEKRLFSIAFCSGVFSDA